MRVLAIVHQRDAGPGVFAEAIREHGVELDQWLAPEAAEPPADPHGYDAVLTLGGAMHADQEQRHRWLGAEKELLAGLLAAGTPLLGLCLGGQLVAAAAGATPRRAAAGDRLAPGRADLRGRRGPAAGAARPQLRGLPVAQL